MTWSGSLTTWRIRNPVPISTSARWATTSRPVHLSGPKGLPRPSSPKVSTSVATRAGVAASTSQGESEPRSPRSRSRYSFMPLRTPESPDRFQKKLDGLPSQDRSKAPRQHVPDAVEEGSARPDGRRDLDGLGEVRLEGLGKR